MLTYKALLLDLDGLIVDSEPLHQRAYNLALLVKGIAFQFNVIEYGKSCVGRSVAELAHILTTTYPQLGSTEDFIRDRERIYEALIRDPDNLQPMPGLLQLLSAAAKLGLKLGVASSSSRAQVQTILTGMVDNDGDPLATHFASIVTGSDVQHKKPAPDIYVKACQQLGLAKEQCVAVEDSKTGIESARAAGIFTIAIPNRFTAHQDLSSANLVLNRLDEVLTMLG